MLVLFVSIFFCFGSELRSGSSLEMFLFSFPDKEKFVLSSVVEKQDVCSWFLSDLEEIIGWFLNQSDSFGISKS